MTKKLYYVELRHSVHEEFRIEAEYEKDAIRMAKSGDFEPASSVKGPPRVTASWPVAKRGTPTADAALKGGA